jgi:hypothetical protein
VALDWEGEVDRVRRSHCILYVKPVSLQSSEGSWILDLGFCRS